MKQLDMMSARQLVADLRETLLKPQGFSEIPPHYGNWSNVYDRIEELIERREIDPLHLIALGASLDIDPQCDMDPSESLIAFCKSVKLESSHNLEK